MILALVLLLLIPGILFRVVLTLYFQAHRSGLAVLQHEPQRTGMIFQHLQRCFIAGLKHHMQSAFRAFFHLDHQFSQPFRLQLQFHFLNVLLQSLRNAGVQLIFHIRAFQIQCFRLSHLLGHLLGLLEQRLFHAAGLSLKNDFILRLCIPGSVLEQRAVVFRLLGSFHSLLSAHHFHRLLYRSIGLRENRLSLGHLLTLCLQNGHFFPGQHLTRTLLHRLGHFCALQSLSSHRQHFGHGHLVAFSLNLSLHHRHLLEKGQQNLGSGSLHSSLLLHLLSAVFCGGFRRGLPVSLCLFVFQQVLEIAFLLVLGGIFHRPGSCTLLRGINSLGQLHDLALLDSIDYIKLSLGGMSMMTLKNVVDIAHSMDKQCIAMGIDNEELYQKAIKLGVDAMEGTYVAAKLTTQAHSSGYLQSNFFRLIMAISAEEPDITEIEKIISVDATLTYGLLKMVNSCYFALRHEVTTVQQAIVIMGLGELRQWAYLLSASNAENQIEEGAEEFLRMSFMRANFCSSLMNYAKNMPISKPDAYMMGMFSTLNYLIDAPMEDILNQIPLQQEVKDALLKGEGRCGMLYQLALSYEQADWGKIDKLAEELGIPTNLLTSLYFNCMEEVNRVWSEITKPAPQIAKEGEEGKQEEGKQEEKK